MRRGSVRTPLHVTAGVKLHLLFEDYTKGTFTLQQHVLGRTAATPLPCEWWQRSAGQRSCAFTLPAFSWLVLRFCGRFVSRDHGLLWSVQEHNVCCQSTGVGHLWMRDFPRCWGSNVSLEAGKVKRLYAQAFLRIRSWSECPEVITAQWDGRGDQQRFLPRSERTGKQGWQEDTGKPSDLDERCCGLRRCLEVWCARQGRPQLCLQRQLLWQNQQLKTRDGKDSHCVQWFNIHIIDTVCLKCTNSLCFVLSLYCWSASCAYLRIFSYLGNATTCAACFSNHCSVYSDHVFSFYLQKRQHHWVPFWSTSPLI